MRQCVGSGALSPWRSMCVPEPLPGPDSRRVQASSADYSASGVPTVSSRPTCGVLVRRTVRTKPISFAIKPYRFSILSSTALTSSGLSKTRPVPSTGSPLSRPRESHGASMTRPELRNRLALPAPLSVITYRRSPSAASQTGVATAAPLLRNVVRDRYLLAAKRSKSDWLTAPE